MTIHVKDNFGAWQPTVQPWVKDADTWKKCKKVLVKQNDAWAIAFERQAGVVPEPTLPAQCTYVTNSNTNILAANLSTTWNISVPSHQAGDILILSLAFCAGTSGPGVTFSGVDGWMQIQSYANTSLTSWWQAFARVAGKGMTEGSTLTITLTSAQAGQATIFVYRPGTGQFVWLNTRHDSTSVASGGPLNTGPVYAVSPARVFAIGYGSSAGTSYSWSQTSGQGGSRTSRRCSLSATSQGRVNCLHDWNLSSPFTGGDCIFSAGTMPTQLATGVYSLNSYTLPGGIVDAFATFRDTSGTTITTSGTLAAACSAAQVGDEILLAVHFSNAPNSYTISMGSNVCDDWELVGTFGVLGTYLPAHVFKGTVARLTDQVVATASGGTPSRGGVMQGLVLRGVTVGPANSISVIENDPNAYFHTPPQVVSPSDNSPLITFAISPNVYGLGKNVNTADYQDDYGVIMGACNKDSADSSSGAIYVKHLEHSGGTLQQPPRWGLPYANSCAGGSMSFALEGTL